MGLVPSGPHVGEVDGGLVHGPVVAEAAGVVVGHADGDEFVIGPFVGGVGAVDDDGSVGDGFSERGVGGVGFVGAEVDGLVDDDVGGFDRGLVALGVHGEVAEGGVHRDRERAGVEGARGTRGGAVEGVADLRGGVGVVGGRKSHHERAGTGDGIRRAVRGGGREHIGLARADEVGAVIATAIVQPAAVALLVDEFDGVADGCALGLAGEVDAPDVLVSLGVGFEQGGGEPGLAVIGGVNEVGGGGAALVRGDGDAGGVVGVDLVALAAGGSDAEEGLGFSGEVARVQQIPNGAFAAGGDGAEGGPVTGEAVGLLDGVGVGGVAAFGVHDEGAVAGEAEGDAGFLGDRAAFGGGRIDLDDARELAVDGGGEVGFVVVVPMLAVGGINEFDGIFDGGAGWEGAEVAVPKIVVVLGVSEGEGLGLPGGAVVCGVNDLAADAGVLGPGFDVDPEVGGGFDVSVERPVVHAAGPTDGEGAELDGAGVVEALVVVPAGDAVGVNDLDGELEGGAAGEFAEVGVEEVVVADDAGFREGGLFPCGAVIGSVNDLSASGGVFGKGFDIDPEIVSGGDIALRRKRDGVADPGDEGLAELGGIEGPSSAAGGIHGGNGAGIAEGGGEGGGDAGVGAGVGPDAVGTGGHVEKLLVAAVDFDADLDGRGGGFEWAVIGSVGDGDIGGIGGGAGLGGLGEGAGDEDFGVFSGEGEADAAAADGDFFRGVEDIGELGAVGFSDLGIDGDIAIGGVEGDEGLLFEVSAGVGVGTGGAALPALGEGAAGEGGVGFAGRVEGFDVEVLGGGGLGEFVAVGGAGLEAAIEHVLALPIAIVGVFGRASASVEVAALIEGVLGAVEEAGDGCGGVEEGEGGLHHIVDAAGVAALGDEEADAVDIVVIDKGDEAVLAFAVLGLGGEGLGELAGAGVIDEHAFDRLAHGEEEGGVEGVAGLFAVAGEGGVVVNEEFAEEDEVVFAFRGRVFADVVGPFFHPVVFDMLDGIDAEAVAIGGVDEVFEGLGDPVGDMAGVGGEIVGAFELAAEGLGEGVPVVDGAVVVEPAEFVEGVGVDAVVVPPAEVRAAAGPIPFVILAIAEAIEVGGVVDDDIENDIDAAGVAGIDEILEVLEGAHHGIDMEEVRGVIHVVGRVAEVLALGVHLDAGDPDGVDAHAGEVIEIVEETLPVAAVVVVAVLREGFSGLGPCGAVDAHGARRVVGGVAIGKAVGEELVDINVAPIRGGREKLVALRTGLEGVGRIENEVRIVRDGLNGEGGNKEGCKDAMEEAHEVGVFLW